MIKLLLLCFLTSCSFFVSKLDQPFGAKNYRQQQFTPIIPSCNSGSHPSMQLIGHETRSQEAFYRFLAKLRMEGIKLSQIDHFMLWSMLQMNLSPYLVTPTSRLQFFFVTDKNHEYWDFYQQEGATQISYPYLYGLDTFLKHKKHPRDLLWYAGLLDAKFQETLFASKEFSSQLFAFKKEIKQNEILRTAYLRGQDILQSDERLPKLNFTKMIKGYRQNKENTQSVQFSQKLFTYLKTNELEANCNYDFNLYDSSIFLIDKNTGLGQIFGMQDEKFSFMAVTSQKNIMSEPLFNEPIFRTDSQIRSSALCAVSNKDAQFFLISNLSRDPGQHLHHLFKFGLSKTKNLDQLTRLIDHSRHLLLSDPLRVVIESGRSKSEQVDELLRLNIPVYNAENLGNIWAMISLQNQTPHFVLDSRTPGAYSCKP